MTSLPSITLLDLVILSFASYRVLRLAMVDEITLTLRLYLFKLIKEGGFIDRLMACPYCLSVWVSFSTYAVWSITPYSQLVLVPLAIAGVSTAIADNLDSNF